MLFYEVGLGLSEEDTRGREDRYPADNPSKVCFTDGRLIQPNV